MLHLERYSMIQDLGWIPVTSQIWNSPQGTLLNLGSLWVMSAPSTRIIGDVLIVHPCIGSSPIPSPELLQSLCLFESLQLFTNAPQAALLRTLEERRTMTSGATLNHDFLGILEETRKDRQLWQLTPNLPKGTAGSGYTSHAGSVLSGLENEAKN